MQKIISTKKLAIYLSIIFFMICGTGFMLYQNKQLISNKPENVNDSAVLNNAAPPAMVPGNDGADSQTAAGVNQNEDLNLNIFSNDKFKNLRANILIIEEQPKIGKTDPFKPN